MRKTVIVTQEIEIEYDETKLNDPGFCQEFNRYFYEFNGIDDHLQHLAQCEARGLIGFDNFVEGYGDIKKMGITIRALDCDTEIEGPK